MPNNRAPSPQPEPVGLSRASTFQAVGNNAANLLAAQAAQTGSRLQPPPTRRELRELTERAHANLIRDVQRNPERRIDDIIAESRHNEYLWGMGKCDANILHCIMMEYEGGDNSASRLVEWVALRHPQFLSELLLGEITPPFHAIQRGAVEYLRCLLSIFDSTNILFGIDSSENLATFLGKGCKQVSTEECRASWARMLGGVREAEGNTALNQPLVGFLRVAVGDEECPHVVWAGMRTDARAALQQLSDFRDHLRVGVCGTLRPGGGHERNRCCLHKLLKTESMKWDVESNIQVLKRLIDVGGQEVLESVDEDGTLPIFKIANFRPLRKKIVEIVAEACPTAVFLPGQGSPSAYRYLRDLETGTYGVAEMTVKDEILQMLKGICLELYSKEGAESDTVRNILFGGVPNVPRMSFDVHAEKKVPVDEVYMNFLEENLKVQFDTILSHLSLPKWAGAPPESETARNRVPQNEVKPWGPYYEAVFHRLYEKWRVRDIRIVEVDDMIQYPHSDEAILKCLEHFKVKELDWAKLDLSSTVLNTAASGVKKLTLHCSGKEAVLLGWSCDDGLVALEHLQQLTLHIDILTEGLATEQKYVKAFSDRLERKRKEHGKGRIAVDVIYTASKAQKGALHTSFSTLGRPGNSPNRRWIDHMCSFAASVETYGPTPTRPVKVAVIDDGIQLGHHNFHIATGCSFWRDEVTHKLKDFWIDSGDHGTLMAEYITKICRMADLYIGRLHDLSTTEGMPSFTAESATEAILWATSQNVDIISMSWSIKTTATNADDIERLRDAIEDARRNGIILFASLSDDRPHPDRTAYPACLNPSVLRIGAATKEGDAFPGIRPEDADHLFPGVDIPYEFNDRHDLVTGSSVATALAAGLAALLIHCMRATGRAQTVTQQQIQLMFQRLENDPGEPKYPSVWGFFHDLVEDKDGLNAKAQLGAILQRLV